MTKEEFKTALAALGLEIEENQLDQLEDYLHLLQQWNEKMNLTAIDKEEEIWEKHFYDSIRPFIDLDFESLVDVGSGAGFPGMVLAILYPDRQITLLEPMQKRMTFLEEVQNKLSLSNVRLLHGRAEDLAKQNKYREQYDLACARAVASLPILLELCLPLVKPKGSFLALKGAKGKEELEESSHALKELSARLRQIEEYRLSGGDQRVNLLFEKTGKSAGKYPRPYGQIKKKPL